MMFGSMFYNWWGALIAFTIYFFATFQSYLPLRVIIGSLIVGLICFFAMYFVRYMIGYIMYTPDHDLFEQFEEENDEAKAQADEQNEQMQTDSTVSNVSSTVEFEDESTEDIAKVVRTMINQEDTATSNT